MLILEIEQVYKLIQSLVVLLLGWIGVEKEISDNTVDGSEIGRSGSY